MAKRNLTIKVRITDDQWLAFVDLAKRRQKVLGEPLSAAALVRQALREWLAKNGGKHG